MEVSAVAAAVPRIVKLPAAGITFLRTNDESLVRTTAITMLLAVTSELVTTRVVAPAAKFTVPTWALIVCAPVVPAAVTTLSRMTRERAKLPFALLALFLHATTPSDDARKSPKVEKPRPAVFAARVAAPDWIVPVALKVPGIVSAPADVRVKAVVHAPPLIWLERI